MEFRHLRYFVAVAEELHFTRAAARLHTAQPGLSQQIRRLEREIGTDLFFRDRHSVELTDAGRLFLEQARRVLDDVDQAKRVALRAAQGDLGQLTIGFAPEAAGELLPELLVAYRAAHPDVDLDIRGLGSTRQVEALLDHRIHLGLLRRPPAESRLRFMFLRSQQLVVAMPAWHRLANRRFVKLGELADELWIQPDTHSSLLFTACAKAGFEPRIAKHATEPLTRLALVAAGVGIALVSESTAHPPSRHIVYRPLDHPKIAIDLDAAWPTDRPSPLVDGFLEVARTVADQQSNAHHD